MANADFKPLLALAQDAMAPGGPLPDDLVEEINRLGEEHGASGAARAIRVILIAHPASLDMLRIGGDVMFSQENWVGAAQFGRWGAVAGSPAVELEMTAAAYLFRARRLDEARIHGQRAEWLTPHDAGPKFLYGRILAASGQVAMGLARIDRAAEIDSRFRYAAKVLHLGLTNEDFERVKNAATGE